MWADSGPDPASRTGTAGIAFLSSVCSQYKYSVSEEKGGFESASVIN